MGHKRLSIIIKSKYKYAWKPQETLAQTVVNVEPLYERIDVKQIDEELEKLAANEK